MLRWLSLWKKQGNLYILSTSQLMLRPTLALRGGWIRLLICWKVLSKNYMFGGDTDFSLTTNFDKMGSALFLYIWHGCQIKSGQTGQ
jgi:hypothetical protein